ncbi:iron-siderophore ABC transporter substrate-binding protein [Streptomyces endophyticus]|uniref:Iron-siderophore ABC transporter substrate-binding protein n=1 Tax=Streptomyces endophyticus TaxID=714166 RepID=A0ABU6FJW4_9ACTN|nr:iron-siderophore ABC transporter substrate-binding protein [Streptomyces endophyticus]MEB8343077.1 iron-siderophore ABC transporter substrate-binding protein [Streptomyces endophyticus]
MRAWSVKAVVGLAVIGSLLTGCASGGDGDGKSAAEGKRNKVAGSAQGPAAAPASLTDGMGSKAADGAFPRTVKHYEGTTKIAARPQRIATISTGQLDDLLTLGTVPVAATRADNAGLVPDYLRDAYPKDRAELAKMADIGTRAAPNLESIEAAEPDLILVNQSLADLYPKLSRIAPTVVTKGQGVNWKRDFLMVGAAVGKQQAAQTAIDGIAADAKAKGDVRGAADTTVSMLRFTPGRTRMFGVSSFTGSIAVDMGVGRPKSQQFKAISQDISAERVDLADGDRIFYSVQGDAKKTDAGSVLAGPLWKSMKAVKAGHAIKVDDDPWYLNAGPTAARLVIKQLANALGE